MSVTEPMREALSKLFFRDQETVFAVSSKISQAWSIIYPYDNGEISIEIDFCIFEDSKEIRVDINFPVEKFHVFPSNTIVILQLENGTFFFCDGEMCGIATNENLSINQL